MKKIYNIVSTALTVMFLIIWVVLLLLRKVQMDLYIASVVLIAWVLFIDPALKYIINKKEEEFSVFKIIFIVFGGCLSYALSWVVHAVIFSINIRADSNYELYNLVILAVIFYFLILHMYKMAKEIKNLSDENRRFVKYMGIIFKYLLTFLFTFMIPFYQYYVPRYEVSLNNLKIPQKLKVQVISKPKTMDNLFEPRSAAIIEDKELIEELISEISALKLDNVRNLDIINYLFMKERSHPFLELYAYYSSDSPSILGDVQNGAFSFIEIYDNSQVILASYNRETKFLKTNWQKLFRVPLSESMLNKLREAFKDFTISSGIDYLHQYPPTVLYGFLRDCSYSPVQSHHTGNSQA